MDREIGTVEILQLRIYRPAGRFSDEVVVPPGVYPLFLTPEHLRYWRMTGNKNERIEQIHKDDEGSISLLHPDDRPTGPEVEILSPSFNTQEWRRLLAEPVCREGHPEQRLRINENIAADEPDTANGKRA